MHKYQEKNWWLHWGMEKCEGKDRGRQLRGTNSCISLYIKDILYSRGKLANVL